MKRLPREPEAPPVRRARPPWHLWPVGMFYVLLNGMGAYDWVMTHRHDAAYFESQKYGDAQIAYFAAYPLLPDVFWTIAITSALAASILLLFRARWATPVAWVGVVSQLGLDLVTFGFMGRWRVFGTWLSLFDLAILLLTAGLLLYCRAMSSRGVLR